MPSHVLVNNLGLTYKGTIGVSTATIPDVCKTPSPGGPIPIPYPNVANQSSLKNGTKTVKAKGKMIAVKGSEYSMSFGDEPGTAGGVKSSTFKKETSWITYSFDVKMDGKNACRHTDKKFHNHKNTVDLSGNIDPLLIKKFTKMLCNYLEHCTNKHDQGAPPTDKWCKAPPAPPGDDPEETNAMARGTAIDKCVCKIIDAKKPPDSIVKTQEWVDVPGLGDQCKPDVIVGTPPDCAASYDIKTSCPPDKPEPDWQTYGDGSYDPGVGGYTKKAKNKSWHGKTQAEIAEKATGAEPIMIHKNSEACKS